MLCVAGSTNGGGNRTNGAGICATMPDRFTRIFMRSQQPLRDLRRYAPLVVVKGAVQVNVGGQQVNGAGEGAQLDPGCQVGVLHYR